MIKYYLLFIVIISLSNSYSQEKGFKPIQPTDAEQRIALVIGNAKYTSAPLRNPENDAMDIAKALRAVNFSVSSYTNLTAREMENAITKFGEQLSRNTVALFYYSGHGVQVNGKNYLIPVGAKINKEQDMKFEAVDAERVIAEMENAKSRMNIVILDACRDNPLPKSARSSSRGLATLDAPMGTIIAYSTAPGKIASDGERRNGLYTEHLIKYVNTSDLKLEDVFKKVRAEVASKTNGIQTPWENSSIIGDFYFKGGSGITSVQTEAKLETKTNQKSENEFSLDDIDKEIEAKKAEERSIAEERAGKLQKMKDAFEKVQAILKDASVEKEKKDIARQRFLQYFLEDLPWTTEDEAMRKACEPFKLNMEFVLVEPGSFQMGSNEYESEKPVHPVTLTNQFYIGKYEVTQKQWETIMGNNPSNFKGDNLPVENVSWNDIQEFLKKLNDLTGEDYRLPTEAEWEYASRGGNKSNGYKFSGSNNLDEVAWSNNNSGSITHEVGTKKPNELGLYDMSGNVWEWCADWYGSYSSEAQTNPTGPLSGQFRVLRGGSWGHFDYVCRVAYRVYVNPVSRYYNGGFRLLREN